MLQLMCDHKVFVYLFKSSFMPLNVVFAEIYTEEIDFLKAEIDFLLNVTCFFENCTMEIDFLLHEIDFLLAECGFLLTYLSTSFTHHRSSLLILITYLTSFKMVMFNI